MAVVTLTMLAAASFVAGVSHSIQIAETSPFPTPEPARFRALAEGPIVDATPAPAIQIAAVRPLHPDSATPPPAPDEPSNAPTGVTQAASDTSATASDPAQSPPPSAEPSTDEPPT